MNAMTNINMGEVTRLTQAGRLAEAMAVLRGGSMGATPSEGGKPEEVVSSRRSRSIIDMVPPSSLGGAWTPPEFTPPRSLNGLNGKTSTPPGAEMPEAMRAFLDRFGKLGPGSGLGGLPGSPQVGPVVPVPEGARLGGAAAAIMGSEYPDLYAAVGVHSGLACGAAQDVPSALAAMRQGAKPQAGRGRGRRGKQRPVPTIVFHGDGDRTVHSVNGDQVIAQSKAGAALREATTRGETPGGMAFTRTVQTDQVGNPVLEQWVLHGAGHAWSGGSPAGSYTDPRGPDASREMLRFFTQHATEC